MDAPLVDIIHTSCGAVLDSEVNVPFLQHPWVLQQGPGLVGNAFAVDDGFSVKGTLDAVAVVVDESAIRDF